MKSYFSNLLILIVCCGGFSGCDKKPTDIPTVAIQATKPIGEEVLSAGDEIQFNISVLTQHAPKGSSVGVIIQAADDSLLGIATPIQVQNGQEIQLSVKTMIPITTSVNIYAALYEDVNKDSIAVDSRVFRVIGIKK